MKKLVLVVLIALCAGFALRSFALSQQRVYPWVYYFEQTIDCAFADAEGNVIVSTGDWGSGTYNWGTGDTTYWYSFKGMFRIREGEMEAIECPADTFVLDCATDSAGTTWVLFAEGQSYTEHTGEPPWRSGTGESDIGFRGWRFPIGPPGTGTLTDYRLGHIDNDELVELPGVTQSIPGTPARLSSGPDGCLYLESNEWDGNRVTAHFLSWWRTDSLPHVGLQIDRILPYGNLWGYPEFGPDGLAYFLFYCYQDSSIRSGVLSVDPLTGQWHIFDDVSSPYLNSETEYFYIDPLNIKWFATDDGLVRFDGETWMCYTTENSGLPYNLVRQMVYDEIDDVYYIISQGNPAIGPFGARSYPYAFSTFAPDGECIGEPLDLPLSSDDLYYQSEIYETAQNVFWLSPFGTGVVYSYDHEQVVQWHVGDWFPPAQVAYIGSTALGRTFCAVGSCVMIW